MALKAGQKIKRRLGKMEPESRWTDTRGNEVYGPGYLTPCQIDEIVKRGPKAVHRYIMQCARFARRIGIDSYAAGRACHAPSKTWMVDPCSRSLRVKLLNVQRAANAHHLRCPDLPRELYVEIGEYVNGGRR